MLKFNCQISNSNVSFWVQHAWLKEPCCNFFLFVGLVFKRAQFVFSTALFEPTSLCVFGFYKTWWYYLFFCISFGVPDMVWCFHVHVSDLISDHTPEIKPEIHFSTFLGTIMKARCLKWETDQSENVNLSISFVLFSFLWNLCSWGNSNKRDAVDESPAAQSKPGWTMSTPIGYH